MNSSEITEMDIVEAALQSWPVAQTPPGFSHRLHRRLEAARQPRLKFRFTWLDYALGLFTASATLLIFFVWKLLPDLFILQLTYRLFVLLNAADYHIILTYFLPGIGGFLTLLLSAAALIAFRGPAVRTPAAPR